MAGLSGIAPLSRNALRSNQKCSRTISGSFPLSASSRPLAVPLHLAYRNPWSFAPPVASRPQRRHTVLFPSFQSTCPSPLASAALWRRSAPVCLAALFALAVVSASSGQRCANESTHLYHLNAVARAALAEVVGESASASFMPSFAALSASMLPNRSVSLMTPSATCAAVVWALTLVTVRSSPRLKSTVISQMSRHRSAPSREGATHQRRPRPKPRTTSAQSVWMCSGGAAMRRASSTARNSARTVDGKGSSQMPWRSQMIFPRWSSAAMPHPARIILATLPRRAPSV